MPDRFYQDHNQSKILLYRTTLKIRYLTIHFRYFIPWNFNCFLTFFPNNGSFGISHKEKTPTPLGDFAGCEVGCKELNRMSTTLPTITLLCFVSEKIAAYFVCLVPRSLTRLLQFVRQRPDHVVTSQRLLNALPLRIISENFSFNVDGTRTTCLIVFRTARSSILSKIRFLCQVLELSLGLDEDRVLVSPLSDNT